MKISYNWLTNYTHIDLSPEETAEKLTLLGLEVEEIEQIGFDFEGFIVGEVLNVQEHPNADKLTLCKVNLGNDTVQIVCGAKNVASGQKVPVATVGSTIPVPMKDGSYLTIKKATLRGEKSNGMICSEAELGLSDDHSGIMVLDEKLQTGTPLKEALNLENDVVFEIGLTPNRPDAACHIGVARDLSAVTGKALQNPYKEAGEAPDLPKDEISIRIEDEDKCHRYVGIIVDGVNVDESPAWLKSKLTAIGLRPINNIVDITNYVLHEIGQPLHAFDYNLIGGKEIIVKSFKKDQKFVTLDSIERNVKAGTLFICDGNGPVAIAGIMGGENSEVTQSTTKILIESAYFDPASIRKSSKNLTLQTDSSYRFERGIDPNLQLKAALRAAGLIAEIAGGTISNGYADIHPVKTEPLVVPLRISRINHLLGTNITKKQAFQILEKLEFGIEEENNDTLLCTVPTFRPDITREVDLIEEVGRIFDYNNIPRPDSAPFIAPEPLSENELFQERLRSLAKSLRYKEITTNSLISEKQVDLLTEKQLQIKTLNPVSSENTTLRTHLTGGFLNAVRYNLNRNARKIRFFEIGHTFRKNNNSTWVQGVEEHTYLLLGLCGNKQNEDWQSNAIPFSFFDLKKDTEAIFSELGILDQLSVNIFGNRELLYNYKKDEIARLCETSPDILKGFDVDEQTYIAEIDITRLLTLGLGKKQVRYIPIVKFPVFEFDAAFTVDKPVRAGDLSVLIKETAGDVLQNVSVFDVYEGENIGKGKKSIAFRLTFLDSNKTLNINDVEPVVQKIVQKLEKTFDAKLRS